MSLNFLTRPVEHHVLAYALQLKDFRRLFARQFRRKIRHLDDPSRTLLAGLVGIVVVIIVRAAAAPFGNDRRFDFGHGILQQRLETCSTSNKAIPAVLLLLMMLLRKIQ